MTSLYVHLIPQTTQLLSETLRVNLPQKEPSINDLRLKILEQLEKGNDGNKVYKIKAIMQTMETGDVIPLNRLVSSYFELHDDVYCLVEIGVDTKKHVKPIEVKPAPAKPSGPLTQIATDNKFVTLAKYSYYESGSKWIKVLLDFKDIKSHSKDKITCEFKPRSFTLRVLDYKG
jgi:hypothetical protein